MSEEYISKLIRKAVDLSTSLDTAPIYQQSLRLQKYIQDPQYVDLVYRKISERAEASAKKQEMKAVNQCIKLLKYHLTKYHPSDSMLNELNRTCYRLQNQLDNQEFFKSLLYIRSLLESISESRHQSQQNKTYSALPIPIERRKSEHKVKYARSIMLNEEKHGSENMTRRKYRKKKSSGSSSSNHKKRYRNFYFLTLKPNLLLANQKPFTIKLSTPETFLSSAIFGGQFNANILSSSNDINKELFYIKDHNIRESLITISLSKKAEERQLYRSFRRQPPLFHYKYYNEQYRLHLGNHMIDQIMNAIMSKENENRMTASKILIKLIMDMLCQDPLHAPIMIENLVYEMLDSNYEEVHAHALNLLFNLSVHIHMYEEIHFFEPEDDSIHNTTLQQHQEMLYKIVKNVLLSLVHRKENKSKLWHMGMNLLLYFVTDRGLISKKQLIGLDPRIICAFLTHINYIAEPTWRVLVRILTNIIYLNENQNIGIPSSSFLKNLCLIGSYHIGQESTEPIHGIKYIIELYKRSRSFESRDNLFCIIYDYLFCCHINRTMQSSTELEPIKEESLMSYKACFKVLTSLEASQAFSSLFKYPPPNFFESTLILIHRVSLSNSYFKNALMSIDMQILHRVLNDFYHLAVHCTKLKQEYSVIANNIIVKKAINQENINKIKSLIYSENEENRLNGERLLFTCLSNIINMEKSVKLNENFIKNIEEIFYGLLKATHPSTRTMFFRITDQVVLFLKSQISNNSQDILNKIFKFINSCFLHAIENQEHNERNIIYMFDIIFNFIYTCPMPAREVTCTPYGKIIEKVYQHDNDNQLSSSSEIKESDLDTTISYDDSQFSDDTASISKRFMSISSTYDSFSTHRSLQRKQSVKKINNGIIESFNLNSLDDSPVGCFMSGKMMIAKSLLNKIDIKILIYIFNHLPPRYTNQSRVAVLHLIIERCKDNQQDMEAVNGSSFFKKLLSENDPHISYLASRFLIDKLQNEQPDQFHVIINTLLQKAVEVNDEKIISNPYLQIKEILEMNNTLKRKDLL